MSYNFGVSKLDISESENPEKWFDEIYEKERKQNCTASQEFEELHNILTAKYPCISSLSDDEIDDGVWSDGPLINNFLDNVAILGILYQFVESDKEDIFKIILTHGFSIIDFQEQKVYRHS